MRADEVTLHIGGLAHAGWQSYDIESSLVVAADAWKVSLATSELQVPPAVQPGADVQLKMGDDVVLKGVLDALDHEVSKGGHRLRMSGRDGAGMLIDCSAPIFTTQLLTLDQVVAKIVRPLGITRIRIDAGTKLLRERVNTEPGDSAWDMLRRAAEANGLWPWFEPDGELVIGGPDYTTAPVASLTLRRDGANVLCLAEARSIVPRYSEVTVLGQAHAVGGQAGKHNVRATQKDTGVTIHRPKIVTDHEATSTAVAKARANKIISDARVAGYELRATVAGHRTEGGKLWAAGQRVNVESEPHNINGVYFVMARRFSGDKQRGQFTQLSLREDGVWALYAHPSKRKHRRGKNSQPGAIIDATKGAAP